MATILYLPLTELPFVDLGPSELSVVNTDVTLDANGKFGNAARFTRSEGTNHLQLPVSSVFNWGTNNWTVHFWAYLHTHTNDDGFWGTTEVVGLNAGIMFNLGTTFWGRVIRSWLGNTGYIFQSVNLVPLTTIVHLALVRDDTFIKAYLNGTLMTSASWAHGGAGVIDPEVGLRIGSFYGDSNAAPCDASISEFIIDDTALWTANFTPPSSPYSVAEDVGFTLGGVSFGNVIIGA